MKHNNIFGEVFVSAALIVLLILSLNPFNIFMPTMLQTTLICILVIVFGAFALFVWREKIRDEREGYHRLVAGRWAFLIGALILVAGIVVQHLQEGRIDPWLSITLGGMVLAKVGGLVYSRYKF